MYSNFSVVVFSATVHVSVCMFVFVCDYVSLSLRLFAYLCALECCYESLNECVGCAGECARALVACRHMCVCVGVGECCAGVSLWVYGGVLMRVCGNAGCVCAGKCVSECLGVCTYVYVGVSSCGTVRVWVSVRVRVAEFVCVWVCECL